MLILLGTIFAVISLSIIILCLTTILLNVGNLGDIYARFVAAVIFIVLATLVGTSIILFIYQLYKQKLRDLEFVKKIKQHNEWASLEKVTKETANYRGNGNWKVWKTARLFELDPQKTIKYFSAILNDEFDKSNFQTKLLEALPLFNDFEDKELIHEQLFDSILLLQKEYFRELQIQETRNTSGYYIIKITPKIMRKFTYFFNLKIEEFISKNILKAFVMTIGYLETNESLHLKRIAELCRISENRAHQFLIKLLHYYPELGNYNDFTMIFKPSKKIFHFEEIVDFERMINS